MKTESTVNLKAPKASPALTGSADDYNTAECLRDEVERFTDTNQFTPMLVTHFYAQAAVVLREHREMADALHAILNVSGTSQYVRGIAARALPRCEAVSLPNDQAQAQPPTATPERK